MQDKSTAQSMVAKSLMDESEKRAKSDNALAVAERAVAEQQAELQALGRSKDEKDKQIADLISKLNKEQLTVAEVQKELETQHFARDVPWYQLRSVANSSYLAR